MATLSLDLGSLLLVPACMLVAYHYAVYTVTLKEVLYEHKTRNEMMSGDTKAFNKEERINGDLIMLIRKTIQFP